MTQRLLQQHGEGRHAYPPRLVFLRKPWWLASRIAPTSPGGGRNGGSISGGLIRAACVYRRDLDQVQHGTFAWLVAVGPCRLQDDIRRSWAGPEAVRRITERTMSETSAMLGRGEIDAVRLFEPFVDLVSAADRGPTSYTTLYARRRAIVERRDDLRRMVRALYRIQK